jgi:hypothetical protein
MVHSDCGACARLAGGFRGAQGEAAHHEQELSRREAIIY